MKVLAIDSALSGCAAGLFDEAGGACFFEQQAMARGQSEELVPMVQRVMDKAGTAFEDVGLIVTTVGPGGFTGLRIGMAAAQGFAIALGKPLAGVTTLEILAAMFFGSRTLAGGELLGVLIETKRTDFYCQFFRADGTPETEPQALSGDEIRALMAGRDVIWIGDAVSRYAQEGERTEGGYDLPDPCVMARAGLDLWKKGLERKVEPLYLRGADVSVSKKTQREILDTSSLF